VASFELLLGQEALLPVEVNLQACRTSTQDALSAKEYIELMMDKIDEVTEGWHKALQEIEREKLQTARAYNKRVRESISDWRFSLENNLAVGNPGPQIW
jgi:hypothetical protein